MQQTRPTVADIRALKGARQLTVRYVDTPDEARATAAAEITRRTSLVMLGMGAGPHADAQYLFAEDVPGHTRGHKPRHAKTYRDFATEFARQQQERTAAFAGFRSDVDIGTYPAPQHIVLIADD